MYKTPICVILVVNLAMILTFYAFLRGNFAVRVSFDIDSTKGTISPKSSLSVKELVNNLKEGSNSTNVFEIPTQYGLDGTTHDYEVDSIDIHRIDSGNEASKATNSSSGNINPEMSESKNVVTTLSGLQYVVPKIHDSGTEVLPRSADHVPSGNFAYVLPQEQRLAMQGRYLFPLPGFNGGPSFQYDQFKEAVQLAVHTNRTIVLSPFKHHRIPAGFSHTLVTFQHTFDVEVFQEFMPIMTVKEFVDRCGSEIDQVWTVPYESYSFERILMTYKAQQIWLRNRQHNLIHIPNPDIVPSSEVEMWRRVFNDTTNESCVMVTNPVQLTHISIPDLDKINDAIDGHFVRTSFIRKAVDNILPKLCEGKPFMSLHWRNKTGERCRVGLHLKQSSRCKEMYRVQQSARHLISGSLLGVMKKHDASCLYIALPPKETKSIVPLLSAAIPRIITMDDVIALHNPDIDSLNGDDYFISLLEQEICSRSTVFVGNGNSNWSVFIYRERRAFGNKPTYDIADLPGFPALAAKYI
ncbi:uncharacterized protein LOC144432866 [Glandiceps talaboti]